MFFKSKRRKLIENAKELVRMGKKVDSYRSDIMDAGDLEELRDARSALNVLLKDKSSSEKDLEQATERLDKIMRKVGGTIYPVGFFADNVEVFLVASILAIGIRTFFFQPFMIPTNSMYPTYNGMIPEVYQEGEAKPGLAERVVRKVVKGAAHYDVKAPGDGEVLIPLSGQQRLIHGAIGYIPYKPVWGTRMIVIPTKKREYTIYVGGKPVSFVVPGEFGIEEVVVKQFFPEIGDYGQMLSVAAKSGMLVVKDDVMYLSTGKEVKAGDSVLTFDIVAGDMLFVDRISYHFTSPKIGDPIVFRTENIEGMKDRNGKPVEKYFIKRMVGQGSDVLEVRDTTLYRNGEPITGAAAFDKNARREGRYPGYVGVRRMEGGKRELIPEGYFYALGDNSPYSQDSRYWGPVPEKEAIGKASFVFYPFSDHWGVGE